MSAFNIKRKKFFSSMNKIYIQVWLILLGFAIVEVNAKNFWEEMTALDDKIERDLKAISKIFREKMTAVKDELDSKMRTHEKIFNSILEKSGQYRVIQFTHYSNKTFKIKF